jgi:hypothetical protein
LIFAAQSVVSARNNTFHQGFEGLSGFCSLNKFSPSHVNTKREVMPIDSEMLATLRDLTAENNLSDILSLSQTGYSIGAIVELACVHQRCTPAVQAVLNTWAKSSPTLGEAFVVFENKKYPSRTSMWSARNLEFFPIAGRNWADPIKYHPFESRFCKAAKEAGFGGMADALTGALFEMADNVVQHSGAGSTDARGLIGYYVCDGHVAFAVGDSGRGVLASLKENPAWAMLSDSKASLLAIVQKSASRRIGLGEGEGFKQMFRSLVDLNGLVEMHSYDGCIKLMQTPTGREAVSQFIGTWPGFQLSVNCSLTKSEEKIIVDYLT